MFEFLNSELLYFLRASITSENFSETLFRAHAGAPSVCWSNRPTREWFHQLWKSLPKVSQDRQNLFDTINNTQDIQVFFDDTKTALPILESDIVFEAMKSLTTHLFTRTKDLADTKLQANSSIESHYQQFKCANSNSELCPLCGTALLSQNRVHLSDEEQWRADYDHVLCKDKYPIYSVHPGNFVPTCHICNSKAKGAKDLLRDKDGNRRRAFYPLPPAQECCYRYAEVFVTPKKKAELITGYWAEPLAEAYVSFQSAPPDVKPKIDVWEEVYKVPSRVEQHITTHFCEHIAADLRPTNFNDFHGQLIRFANAMPLDYRSMEWRFWWQRVYEHLSKQDQDFLRDLWSLIDWKIREKSDEDMDLVFS
ncbi:hypothetical protein [Marinobacter salicampi]|uniref:hypothetical protein n=1 Tax=Marinobacter salicampi TaxID=435907 RepID=UPI001A952BC6|nr:hypothetical protein [Marinobacter salicampi]